jgi:orotate phosphoribosyltransferase
METINADALKKTAAKPRRSSTLIFGLELGGIISADADSSSSTVHRLKLVFLNIELKTNSTRQTIGLSRRRRN